MNKLDSSGFSSSGPILVVGRISTSPEDITNRVLEGSTDLKITETLQTQQLVQRPADWVMRFSERSEKVLAFVGVVFGPAPASDFEKCLWKGEFVEAEHPRQAPGSPEGGRFCSADETESADSGPEAIDTSR